MSDLTRVLAAVDKFEEKLGFTAPELTAMRIGELRAMVRDIFEDDSDDAPGTEPKAAVIIVTEARSERDRRYDANQAEVTEDGHLRLLRKGREIGGYQLDGWLSWREDGAIADDVQAKALSVARSALNSAWREICSAQAQAGPLGVIVDDAIRTLIDLGYE